MTKILAQMPDVEALTIDYLKAALLARGQNFTIGNTVPANRKVNDKSHVLVALDGTPKTEYPFRAWATIRVTAWDKSTTAAKALVTLCEGLLCSCKGAAPITGIQSLTGPLPARDANTSSEMVSITVRVSVRYQQLV